MLFKIGIILGYGFPCPFFCSLDFVGKILTKNPPWVRGKSEGLGDILIIAVKSSVTS